MSCVQCRLINCARSLATFLCYRFYHATLCSRGICAVCLFICQKLVLYRNDWTAWRLPSTYATLSCNEIRVLQKIRVISRELCRKLWTRQFCHGKSIIIETRRRVMVVYHTSVDRNALTPLRRFAVDLLYDLFLQLCSS